MASKKPATSWRDTLKIHPAADLFPLMSADEQRVHGEDIVKKGLTSPIALWQADGKTAPVLLDGRNRLDGVEIATGCQVQVVQEPIHSRSRTTLWSIKAGDEWIADDKVVLLDASVDPYAYVVSANIHRRHLTPEKKRELIGKLLAAKPEASNVSIAKIAKADDKTVAAVRREKEATSEIPKLTKRVGADGRARKQPSTRKPWSRERWVAKQAESAEKNRKLAELAGSKPGGATAARADIGATSTGELARLNVCIGDLQIENRRLTNENLALKAELAKTKDELAKVKTELDEIIAAQADDSALPSTDAGDKPGLPDLPLPPFPWRALS